MGYLLGNPVGYRRRHIGFTIRKQIGKGKGNRLVTDWEQIRKRIGKQIGKRIGKRIGAKTVLSITTISNK